MWSKWGQQLHTLRLHLKHWLNLVRAFLLDMMGERIDWDPAEFWFGKEKDGS